MEATLETRPMYDHPEQIRVAWRNALEPSVARYRGLDRLFRREPQDATDHLLTGMASEKSALDTARQLFDPNLVYSESWWKEYFGFTSGWDFDVVGAFAASYALREAFTSFFSFSIPSEEAIRAIVEFVGDAPLYEYLAGTGYWAFLLAIRGVTVHASDLNKSHYKVSKHPTFHPVRKTDIRHARPPRMPGVVMLSWIPYESNCADRLLKRMHKGQKLIHISEGDGGCCASDSTFAILEENFKLVGDQKLVQFPGLHDYMAFYERL